MGRPKKTDPFEDLDSDLKDTIAAASEEDIRARIAKAALDQEALEQAKKDDQDLAERKEAYGYAMAPYREGRKQLKLLIQYSRTILDARGKESGTSPTET